MPDRFQSRAQTSQQRLLTYRRGRSWWPDHHQAVVLTDVEGACLQSNTREQGISTKSRRKRVKPQRKPRYRLSRLQHACSDTTLKLPVVSITLLGDKHTWSKRGGQGRWQLPDVGLDGYQYCEGSCLWEHLHVQDSGFTVEVRPNAEHLPIHLTWSRSSGRFEGRDIIESERVPTVSKETVQDMFCTSSTGEDILK